MRWDAATNDPPIMGKGARVYLDGVELRYVRAFDTEEGWADVCCTDGHTGHPGQAHVDPLDANGVCTKVMRGTITVDLPEPVVPEEERDAMVEAFKQDIDRTLIRENLRLTPEQRVRNLMSLQELAKEARRGGKNL